VRVTARFVSVIALALLVAGCDKCGHWFGLEAPFGIDLCQNKLPPQQ